ncbi:MAG: hypothetical protein ABSD59_03990 [Terracidiphilus sp.]
MALLVFLAAALPCAAQYPGQIAKPDDHAPTMRAVAVFEWTGDEAKPKTSRLVPICIYDGQQFQDADEYLARPFPLALEGDVEYQLFNDGKPVGLFDIETAAREQGAWVGYGKHFPMPAAKPAPKQVAKIDAEDDSQSDTPILHRKHHAGDAGGSGGSTTGSGSGSGPADPNAPAPDPDRPTLHKGGDASGSSAGDSSGSSSGSNSGSSPASDPDRPQLHRLPDSSSSSGDTSTNGSNQPKLKKKKSDEDEGYVSDVSTLSDPNRPHLFRGKSAGYDALVTPSLRGMPPDIQQQVAVSDVTDRPEHVWDYIWANADDEGKMKAAMEDLARTALGLNPPPAPAKPAHKSTTTAHKPKQPTPPPQPAPLVDEHFRVFELAYGSGATMVLSAHTDGTGEQEKFVTLIGQPDLYGNVAVLVKNVTDAAHLDDTPRMRLVDAVDALADNRGELVFELRGSTQRQFALYRVLRGDAKRIFVSDTDAISAPTGQ